MTHHIVTSARARAGSRSPTLVLAAALGVTAALLWGHLGVPSARGVDRLLGGGDQGRPTATVSVGSPGVGRADGVLPAGGVSVLDRHDPGVTRLDPALLAALRTAASEASRSGVRIVVNSGWRSPAYQEELLREAVATYGSERAAARWVATATTSPHVRGEAVDLGPSAATSWLARHGAAYGLCRVYRNEPWHFELRPSAPGDGCPATYADPTHDPRMQS